MMNAVEKINTQVQAMTLTEMITAQTTKNTVFGEALYELKRSIPGYTEAIQIPSEEENYFDYVIRYPEDEEAPVIVLRHTCYVQIYFEYKFYTFDLLDPDLDEAIECLPAECLCVNPYDIMARLVERISSEIHYKDLVFAYRKYRQ